MATTAISVREYLATSYRPDRDYVDGQVQERSLGEQEHALLQNFLAAWFFNHRDSWRMVSLTEQRVQVSSTRYRIPDVCLRDERVAFESVLHLPPRLCIEILSREDRLNEVRQRVDDYVQMGVRNIWIVDPHARRAYVCVDGKFEDFGGDTLRIQGTDIHVPLAKMWAELDR